MNSTRSDAAAARAIAQTREWLEKAVIGLDLCPFAGPVHLSGRIAYRISWARNADELVGDLAAAISALMAADPRQVETTLLIHPDALADFSAYNDFLDIADATVQALGFEGELQVASFHPRYRFAGSGADDIENYTNRAPHPTLHLLREESIARAVVALPDTDAIYQRNIRTLQRLGMDGWRRLWIDQAPSG